MEFKLARLAGQGDPNLRKHGKVVVDWRLLGVGNNQSSRVQATRLYTTSYQTVRIQDWKDYIDLQGAILKPRLQQPGGPRGPADNIDFCLCNIQYIICNVYDSIYDIRHKIILSKT